MVVTDFIDQTDSRPGGVPGVGSPGSQPSIPRMVTPAMVNLLRDQKKPIWRYIFNLLVLSRSLEATDHRDKVFALPGLAETTYRPCFTPDYNDPVEVAYIKAARSILYTLGRSSFSLSYKTARSVRSLIFDRGFPVSVVLRYPLES